MIVCRRVCTWLEQRAEFAGTQLVSSEGEAPMLASDGVHERGGWVVSGVAQWIGEAEGVTDLDDEGGLPT